MTNRYGQCTDDCTTDCGACKGRGEQHRLTVRRFTRGTTSIAPRRLLYGSTGRCTCGWTGRTNNAAPSQGGRRDLLHAHHHDTGKKAVL